MGIRRAVPDLTSADLARSRAFYSDFLGFTMAWSFYQATRSEQSIDALDLPAATIPMQSVSLGIAPAGSREGDVAFQTQATLDDGLFHATIETPVVPGDYEVWARNCLGSECGTASTPLVPG